MSRRTTLPPQYEDNPLFPVHQNGVGDGQPNTPTPEVQVRGRRWRGFDVAPYVNERFLKRFWRKVEKGPHCWTWTAYTTPAGYGQFTVAKNVFRTAHVVSYALASGEPIPPGYCICHHCDNPPCVRPTHLFLGTPRDNAMDMFAKGRQGSRHPGVARPNARLTDEAVRAIRSTDPYYGRTAALAREFGVSQTTVRKILRGQKWSHVQ